MPDEYRLIPEDAPKKRGPSASLYARILDDFVSSGAASARIDVPGKSPNTIAVGLGRAIKSSRSSVTVTRRDESVYLHL